MNSTCGAILAAAFDLVDINNTVLFQAAKIRFLKTRYRSKANISKNSATNSFTDN
jgi:hypothetical protein